MYAKIKYNCILDSSEKPKEGYKKLALDYDSFIKNKIKGIYKTCEYGVILKNGLPELKKVSSFNEQNITTKTNNAKQKLLDKLKENFEKNININIKYKNGQYYKPRYASENYELMLANPESFPKQIWDATKINSCLMTYEELKELCEYLTTIYEKQFQQYKTEYARILNN